MALGELAKPSVTLAVTLTTVTGYLLASGCLVASMWIPVLGVFVLAAGSAALNQWQERDIDARMPRTRHRPIPSGRIEPTTALFVAIVMMLAGLTLLTSAGRSELLLLALGGFALVWYNGVYTYLKRLTAFAVVPGALIGSVPPCIGYVAAGGDLHDPELLLVAMFFFIWQIPHFWLLMLIMGDEYEAAGLPSLTQTLRSAATGEDHVHVAAGDRRQRRGVSRRPAHPHASGVQLRDGGRFGLARGPGSEYPATHERQAAGRHTTRVLASECVRADRHGLSVRKRPYRLSATSQRTCGEVTTMAQTIEADMLVVGAGPVGCWPPSPPHGAALR